MKTIKRYITWSIICCGILSGSCTKWMDIKPENGLVAQDFWQTKEHVRSAVNGIYISLLNSNLAEQLFVHGELRTDMVELTTFTNLQLDEYRYANLNSSNPSVHWAPFYRIINFCNNVIENAPKVKDIDPTLTQADLDAYIGEALAIRAWMYLNLGRIWGDVPLKLNYTASDEEELNIAKSGQADIFAAVVADLVRAEPMVKETFGTTTAADKGKVTKYTVNALLADVYLWQDDFQKAAAACDVLINSGKFDLVPGNPSSWLNVLFATGNSIEGIFELQYDRQFLNNFIALFSLNPRYQVGQNVYENLYMIDETDPENFDIRGNRGSLDASTGQIYKYQAINRDVRKTLEESYTHWFVYRYADVLLMKAEALNGMEQGEKALELIYQVRERANALVFNDLAPNENDFQGITSFLVDERAREFAYEGKRWFDVLRHARRNNYARLDLITNMVMSYAPPDRQQAMLNKYRDPGSHYLPIYFTELQMNKALVQNPFYGN
ncbi:RagB/SusD family nutrient uptake outer membrane protein [Sphingobacterium olei]|uniref:RagB/SusD family nutrient uptake outer membrane protein n=1 Tax=Sphingobacterium olei TaxID=2571155 RepID=A0A4U0P3F9_9SPHI|nr:RagB/SusD family nutrient uptake outer membrane protein [Sphingobacterium olei]TJZ61803.1 RagB/SusD family nutrient uptake outer membrane protein [Sphingobacterium olei]